MAAEVEDVTVISLSLLIDNEIERLLDVRPDG